jgi:hypothetical protein
MLENILRQVTPLLIFPSAREVANRLKIGLLIDEGIFASKPTLPLRNVLLNVQLLNEPMSCDGYELSNDYYSNADVGKYCKYGKQAFEPGCARIVDPALVFQNQKQTAESSALQAGLALREKKSC